MDAFENPIDLELDTPLPISFDSSYLYILFFFIETIFPLVKNIIGEN